MTRAILPLLVLLLGCKDDAPSSHSGDTTDTACTDTGPAVDSDGDGFFAGSCPGMDCDDSDPSVFPGATELNGNTVDEDCDGLDGSGLDTSNDKAFLQDDYSQACSDAIQTITGSGAVSMDVYSVMVVDSTKNGWLMEEDDRRPTELDSRAYSHRRGLAEAVDGMDGNQSATALWDEYDPGAGVRPLYLVTDQSSGRVLAYYWAWEGDLNGSGAWQRMGRLHWALPECEHPLAHGGWSYASDWQAKADGASTTTYSSWTDSAKLNEP